VRHRPSGGDRLTAYHAGVTDLSSLLKQAGVPAVYYVASGIPLSIVDDNMADEILRVAEASLGRVEGFCSIRIALAI
jgi:hypothetical protein